MSLLRLWWIPYGETASAGGYVNYPLDDLLAILALESQRHRCAIIGEDLGIVPPEIVQKLREAGVLSYKVLYFEQQSDGFRPPSAISLSHWRRQLPTICLRLSATGKKAISSLVNHWVSIRMPMF